MSTITGVFVPPERVEVIKERVARGTARLDEVKPDWRSSVNTSRLDMEDSYQCVLGQAFWSYGHGLVCLEIQAGEGSVEHGFILAATEMIELYPEALERGIDEEQEILTALWVEEINKEKGDVA